MATSEHHEYLTRAAAHWDDLDPIWTLLLLLSGVLQDQLGPCKSLAMNTQLCTNISSVSQSSGGKLWDQAFPAPDSKMFGQAVVALAGLSEQHQRPVGAHKSGLEQA